MAWREVNTTAVWSRIETFCCLNSFAERLSTLMNGRKSILRRISLLCRSKEISLMPVSAATQVLS